jgi:hypothetical protein
MFELVASAGGFAFTRGRGFILIERSIYDEKHDKDLQS